FPTFLSLVPILFQQAGWILPLFVFLVTAVLSGSAALFVCESMSTVEGNHKFEARVEFTTLAELFLGTRYHIGLQIILFLSLQSLNIASMIISTQNMDALLVTVFGNDCGIAIFPPGLVCIQDQATYGSPFAYYYMFVTGGLLITFGLVFPLGLLNLVDNIWVQIASCITLGFILVEWIVDFLMQGLDFSKVPAVGTDPSQVVGIVLFNFAFITTMPSFVNSLPEQEVLDPIYIFLKLIDPCSQHQSYNVSIRKCVWWSVGISTAIYLVIGVLGAAAIQIDPKANLLSAIQNSANNSTLSIVTANLFSVAVLITSIPVYTIVIRSNLVRGQVCNRGWAIFWSSIFPWLIVIPFQTGEWLNDMINYVSLIFTSSSNFIIPFLLYFAAKRYKARAEIVQDGPGDEFNLVLMDSQVSGLTINTVHMASEHPEAHGHQRSRTNSLCEQGPVSPIITVIPPDVDEDNAWDSRLPSAKQLTVPSNTSYRVASNLPTIVEPPGTTDGEDVPRTLRPHGLKIVIPQQRLMPSQLFTTSPRQMDQPGIDTHKLSAKTSDNNLRVTAEPLHPPTLSQTQLQTQTLSTNPSLPAHKLPSSTSADFTPLPSVSLSISIRSVHSRKSSVDSSLRAPSVLVSMSGRRSPPLSPLNPGPVNRLEPVEIFHAFPQVKHFNPVVWAWISMIITIIMVVTIMAYDFTVLGITNGHTTLQPQQPSDPISQIDASN
ncbi:hypothetical protein BC937DRAFT_87253, partial [Endogone sp. FLAS-F59071]